MHNVQLIAVTLQAKGKQSKRQEVRVLHAGTAQQFKINFPLAFTLSCSPTTIVQGYCTAVSLGLPSLCGTSVDIDIFRQC